jgi:hypothetical protein
MQEFYESLGYACDCDSVDLHAYCTGTYGLEFYTLLVLGYDATFEDYNIGVDCTCPTPTCDTGTSDCVTVFINDLTCGTFDVVADSDLCLDCSVCSTATGLISYEADACYPSDVGCIQTLLLASIFVSPFDTQSPTQTFPPESSTFPSTTAPTDPFSTVSPTDPLSTAPPTSGQFSPPNNVAGGGATAPPNNGFFGSGGTLVEVHKGVLVVVTMVFLTLSLHM